MYDELDMALESAYEDGYYQALADMGVDPDDVAEEDIDIFDDNYFDDASEGAARDYRHKMNAGKSSRQIRDERAAMDRDEMTLHPRDFRRHNQDKHTAWNRESYIKYNHGKSDAEDPEQVRTKQAKAYVERVKNNPEMIPRIQGKIDKLSARQQKYYDLAYRNYSSASSPNGVKRMIHGIR